MIGVVSENIGLEFQKSFQSKCIDLVLLGYKKLLKNEDFDSDWHETDITSQLKTEISKLEEAKKDKIDVTTEYPLTSEIKRKGDAKKHPRLDLRMMNWSLDDKVEFRIEAKNLCENNWEKSTGTKVNAANLVKEYVTEGMDRFASQKYPSGCMLGYILQGDISKVVSNINKYLEKVNSAFQKLKGNQTVFNDSVYISNYVNESKTYQLELKHIMLDLTLQLPSLNQ